MTKARLHPPARIKVSPGMLLMLMAVLAIAVVNSPLGVYYEQFLNQRIFLQIGDFNLFSHHGHPLTMAQLINDALMALFFFMAGLEIKREIVAGELSSPRKALLPIVAACGGMILPVILYILISPAGNAMRGVAIPMATDIAFSLGVLALLGRGVPLSLKIFLTTFAVVDDIGGIIVIALFYSSEVFPALILIILLLLAIMYVAGARGVSSRAFYFSGFVLIWFLMLQSGIHATIAGVLVAAVVPTKPRLKMSRYVSDLECSIQALPLEEHEMGVLSHSQIATLKYLGYKTGQAVSPLQSLEESLAPVVNFLILPLFAFANAGIDLEGLSFAGFRGLPLTIILSLVAGKLVGIFSFTWLSVRIGWLSLPANLDFRHIFGVALLGGIGFTVSLFIASLSFGDIENGADLLNNARMGIFSASIIAGTLGYIYLKNIIKKQNP